MFTTVPRISLLTLFLLLNPIALALANPLPTTPSTNTLSRRHNYAMICGLSSSLTKRCSNPPLYYYCTQAGGLSQNVNMNQPYQINDDCIEFCVCYDTSPAPLKANCIINIDGSATCNGAAVVPFIETAAVENTAVARRTDPNTNTLLPRHSYALICALSARETNFCSAPPLYYYCTAGGALAQNFPKDAPIVINDGCEVRCECFDTDPGPPKVHCIVNIDGSATCTYNGEEVVVDAADLAALVASGATVDAVDGFPAVN